MDFVVVIVVVVSISPDEQCLEQSETDLIPELVEHCQQVLNSNDEGK